MHSLAVGVSPDSWQSGIDYLRLTYQGLAPDIATRYHMAMLAYGKREPDSSEGIYRLEAWQMLQYKGFRLGTVAWGESEQGYLFQVSGWRANLFAGSLPPNHNIARVDVQTTLWYTGVDIDQVITDTARFLGSRPSRGNQSINLIDGHGAGNTLYVNRRGGRNVFIRLYNKGKESKLEAYTGAIRLECELSDDYARAAIDTLDLNGWTQGACYGLVRGYLEALDVEIPDIARSIARPSLPKDKSDTERRLIWLERQVAPAIHKLLTTGVSLDEIYSRLGIQECKDHAAISTPVPDDHA